MQNMFSIKNMACSHYGTTIALICSFQRTHSTFVYRMGRLCGGAHEIPVIKAPVFLRGWVEGGGVGVVGG